MKTRWVILILAGLVVVAAWSAMGIAYFMNVSTGLWVALVTTAALSLEGFFWLAAGLLGWSFLAGRRAALARMFQRLKK